jgi:sulfoxide reductase heme-binding subunit YedZ
VGHRLPTRVWHGVHLTSYGAWVVTTVHLLQAGSDASTPVVHFLALTATAAVALLSVYALSVHGTRRTASPVSAR